MRISFAERLSALSKTFSQRLGGLELGLAGVVAMVGIVGLLFSETVYATPAAPDLTITVRVFNYSQASPIILARAEHEAARILGKAGLKVEWLDCTPGHSNLTPQDPCQKEIDATDIRLRILLAPDRCDLQDSVFGFAIAPTLATVYYQSALDLAKNHKREFEAPIVLGCVIAHEIGHLLLGSNRHSASGVMRARWEHEHIRLALMGAMLFTSDEASLMQAESRKRNDVTGNERQMR